MFGYTLGQTLLFGGLGLLGLTAVVAIVFYIKRPAYNPEAIASAPENGSATQALHSEYPTDPITRRHGGTDPLAEGTDPLAEETQPLAEDTQPLPEGTEALAQETEALLEGTQPLAIGAQATQALDADEAGPGEGRV